MRKISLFPILMLVSVLGTVVSCKERQTTPVSGDYKVLEVSATDKTLYSNYSATIQGK